jgi:hypothetical protein
MGKQATETKRPKEIFGSKHKGPLPNAKSKSLKFASQATKKAVMPPK